MQLQAFLMVVHVLLAISLIGLILIQHGKGADAGAAFGSGASSTVFGARGSGSFLTKITTFLAIAFFANCLGLAYLSAQVPEEQSLIDSLPAEEASVTIESPEPPAAPPAVETNEAGAAKPAAADTPADSPAVD